MARLRLIPREESFFDLFEEMARKVQQGAEELHGLLSDYSDLDRKAGRVLDIEHEGDELTHEVMRRLNTTFITPFDREDIHRLASSLDDVLDHIEAAADLFVLHKIEQPLPQMIKMAGTLSQAAATTAEAMPNLRTLNHLPEFWIEVNRLENQADQIHRRLLAHLFNGSYPTLEVMKLKQVVDVLEEAADAFEHVANVVETISVKES